MEQSAASSTAPGKRWTPSRLMNPRSGDAESPRNPIGHISTVSVDRSGESKVPKDGLSFPSPLKHAEEKYGNLPVNNLYKRMGDISITHQARESIKKVLESYQRSLNVLAAPPLVLPEIDIPGLNRSPSPSKTNKSVNFSHISLKHATQDMSDSSFGRTKPFSSSMPPSPMPDAAPASAELFYYSDDGSIHQSHENSRTSRTSRAKSRNGLPPVMSEDVEQVLCVPSGWSPSSLSYATVERPSKFPPSLSRQRQKKLRIVSLKKQLEAQKLALEKNARILEIQEEEREKRRQMQRMVSFMRYVETVEEGQNIEKLEHEYQKLLREEQKKCSLKAMRESMDDEARRIKEHENEVAMYNLRLSENEAEKDNREKIYQGWEAKTSEKKKRLSKKHTEVDSRVMATKENQQSEMSSRWQQEQRKIMAANERKKTHDEETRTPFEFPDKLNKFERNRARMRQEFEEKVRRENEEYERKCKGANEDFERTIEEKRERMVQKGTSAEENVQQARQKLMEKAQQKSVLSQTKQQEASSKRDELESEHVAEMQQVAEHLVEKGLRVDVIKLEKEENDRIIRHVRKLEIMRHGEIYDKVLHSFVHNDYDSAIEFLEKTPLE